MSAPFTSQGNWMRFAVALTAVVLSAALVGNCQRIAETGCQVLPR
jgi:hypothetical protein